MAEKVVVDVEIKDNVKSLKAQYKEAVQEVQRLADVYGETSQQVAQAAKRAAELKDKIEDANDAIAAFKGEGTFVAAGKAISSVASGFSAVEGAMGLVGVESEKLQETLLKVQSAMALAQGLEGLEDAGRSFKQLGTVAVNAFKGMTTASKAFMLTGLGLIITGLATVIAYWDDIKSAMSGVSDEQNKLNVQSEANVKLQNQKKDALNGQENILKQQGLSEKQILQLKIKQTEQQIKALEISIQNQEITLKSQIEAEKRNKNILAGIIKFVTYPLQLILKTIDGIGSFLGKDWNLADNLVNWTASLVFDPKEVETEGLKAIAEQKKTLMGLKNELAGYQNAVKDIDKQAAEEKKKLAQEAADKAKAERERQKQEDEKNLTEEQRKLKEAQDLRDKANEERIKKQDEYDRLQRELIQDAQEKEIADLVAAYEEKFAASVDNAELEKQLEEALKSDIAAIQEKYRKDKEAKDKEAADKELETQRALFQQKKELQLQDIDMAISAIGVLKDVFEDNKKFQKAAMIAESALGIAKIIVNTQVANAAALATPQAIATSGLSAIPVIARNNISAGIGIAANVASTVKALQSLGGGGAPSPSNLPNSAGGGGNTDNQPTPANFNIVGNAGANPLAGLNQPIQAYVVSGQVTTAQEMERNTYDYATFG